MGIGNTWERVAPPGSAGRRAAPFALAALAGALIGGLAVAAFSGDDDRALAAPPPGFAVAAAPVPGAPPPAPGIELPPRPDLQAQALQPPPGDDLPGCLGDHGVGPRPESGRWPRSQRPDAQTLRRALRACLDRSPRLPVPPVPGRGG